MERALDLLDEIRDAVQTESGPELAEVAGLHFERFVRGGSWRPGKTAPEGLVDDGPEGPAGSPRQRRQLGRQILVEGDGRAHALMLRK